MICPSRKRVGAGPVAQVVPVVEARRNAARLPFGIGVHKTFELRVRHQVPVEIKTVHGHEVLGNLLLQKLSGNAESLFQLWDVNCIDADLDGATRNPDH